VDRKYYQYEVVKETGLSRYMVQILTKKYNIGTIRGRYTFYTEEDMENLKFLAHIRRYSRLIYKIFRYIKRHPGCTRPKIFQHMRTTQYRYAIAFSELTFMCYLWESDDATPKYYIHGDFFDEYMEMFSDWRKDEQFTINGRVVKE